MHIDLYDVTKENIGDYLEVNSAGFITKLNGVSNQQYQFRSQRAPCRTTMWRRTTATPVILQMTACSDRTMRWSSFYQDDYYLDNYGMFLRTAKRSAALRQRRGKIFPAAKGILLCVFWKLCAEHDRPADKGYGGCPADTDHTGCGRSQRVSGDPQRLSKAL